MPKDDDSNFTWKHFAWLFSALGVVVVIIICSIGLFGAKADQTIVTKLESIVDQKADKVEVIRVEDRLGHQIQEVKEDLQKDIGSVQVKLNQVYLLLLKKDTELDFNGE